MTRRQRPVKRRNIEFSCRGGLVAQAVSFCLFIITVGLLGGAALAQEEEPMLRAGEAYATRFSGITSDNGQPVIYSEGVVGSIVDIRNPGVPPQGQHWIDEPQRMPVTAAEVGQVFGIALDDEDPPNIYLTATSAFGLHRSADDADWMSGMWGPEGGPGTIYKLNKDNGYAPEFFTDITLGDDERANSGPALGNIAYDKWNKQLYVSDLETGMIHRLSVDGEDLGYYDHGTEGRTNFYDVETSADLSLAGVEFDPATSARIDDCPEGNFANTPACWNYADFRRRAWGLGVRQDGGSGEVRLYYAIWGSQGFGNPEWNADDDEARNSVWSVGIGDDGSFDPSSVRREFFLPDFFQDPAEIARAGYSHPVTDIAFPKCAEQNIMLVSERGGVRNLGLAAEDAFAWPHESRVIRYELNEDGVWQAVGRYDVGFYERAEQGQPFVRANSAGGIDFGLGYTEDYSVDPEQPNQFVWTTGDALCSPKPNGACVNPETGNHDDTSQVHGLQGTPQEAYAEMAPAAAYQSYPADGPATAPEGPDQSYMIDLDINVDENGAPIDQELARNDATLIGDVEIYVPCEGPAPEPETFIPPTYEPPADEPPTYEPPPAHDSILTHRRWGSPEHAPRATHRRWGSPEHTPRATHRRWGSPEHTPRATHRRWGSPEHTPRATHRRWGSPEHTPRATHRKWGSPEHHPKATHRKWGSPEHHPKATHRKWGSPEHKPKATHRKWGSPEHKPKATHRKWGSPQHNPKATHRKRGSKEGHSTKQTHRKYGSKEGGHKPKASHRKRGSKEGHSTKQTHRKYGSKEGGHKPKASHRKRGSKEGGHKPKASHRKSGSKEGGHKPKASHRKTGSKEGGHKPKASHRKTGSKEGGHKAKASHKQSGSKEGGHKPKASHRKSGSGESEHKPKASHRKSGSNEGGQKKHKRKASKQNPQ